MFHLHNWFLFKLNWTEYLIELLPFQHHILQSQWANYKTNKIIFRLKVEKVFVSTEESLPRGTLSVKGIEFSSNKDPLLSRSGDKGYIPTAKTHWSILEILFSWKSEDQKSQNLLLSFHLLQSLIPFTVPETQPLFSTIPDPFRRTWSPDVIFYDPCPKLRDQRFKQMT